MRTPEVWWFKSGTFACTKTGPRFLRMVRSTSFKAE